MSATGPGRSRLPRGLYAIADTRTLGTRAFEPAVAAALAGGAVMVQYRDKSRDTARRRREASRVVALCRAHGAVSIINDDADLAAEVGADGVHLGGGDLAPAAARDSLGATAIVGVSCYNEIERARTAAAAHASYVAFGSVFPSPTKPDAVHAPLALLAQARRELALPVCAIGGITVARAPELIAAGADLLAVIGDLFAHRDVEAHARRFRDAFTPR